MLNLLFRDRGSPIRQAVCPQGRMVHCSTYSQRLLQLHAGKHRVTHLVTHFFFCTEIFQKACLKLHEAGFAQSKTSLSVGLCCSFPLGNGADFPRRSRNLVMFTSSHWFSVPLIFPEDEFDVVRERLTWKKSWSGFHFGDRLGVWVRSSAKKEACSVQFCGFLSAPPKIWNRLLLRDEGEGHLLIT